MGSATLLFDLDGTLVDSVLGIAQALSALRRGRGGNSIGEAELRPLVSLGAAELVRQALGPLAGDPVMDVAAFRVILAQIPASDSWIYPGARQALATLSSWGHPMAVVTNKPEGLARILLGQLGLSRHFIEIVGGDTTSCAKPEAEPVLHALAATNGTAKAAILIGDSFVDAGAARAAGVPFILFEGGYDPRSCDPTDVYGRFSHFDQLPGLIRGAGPTGDRNAVRPPGTV